MNHTGTISAFNWASKTSSNHFPVHHSRACVSSPLGRPSDARRISEGTFEPTYSDTSPPKHGRPDAHPAWVDAVRPPREKAQKDRAKGRDTGRRSWFVIDKIIGPKYGSTAPPRKARAVGWPVGPRTADRAVGRTGGARCEINIPVDSVAHRRRAAGAVGATLAATCGKGRRGRRGMRGRGLGMVLVRGLYKCFLCLDGFGGMSRMWI